MGKDPLITAYLDNLNNGSSNKYEKNLKNRKKSQKFHAISLSFDTPSRLSKFYTICNGFNLTVFDEVSNDNEIA
jgi:hypothetical protein